MTVLETMSHGAFFVDTKRRLMLLFLLFAVGLIRAGACSSSYRRNHRDHRYEYFWGVGGAVPSAGNRIRCFAGVDGVSFVGAGAARVSFASSDRATCSIFAAILPRGGSQQDISSSSEETEASPEGEESEEGQEAEDQKAHDENEVAEVENSKVEAAQAQTEEAVVVAEDAVDADDAAETAEAEEVEESGAGDVVDDPTIDEENSSAFVDRMELADAYDEDVDASPEELELDDAPASTTAEAAAAASTATQPEEAEEPASPIDETKQTDVAADDSSSSSSAAPVESEAFQPATEITEDMEKVLVKELKYRRKEVRVMRPDIATVAVSKRLRRPLEGMPDNWYVTGSKPSGARVGTSSILLRPTVIVSVVAGAAFVVLAGTKKGELDISEMIDSCKELFSSITASKASGVSSESVSETTPGTEAEEEEVREEEEEEEGVAFEEASVLRVNEHTNKLGEPHPHSIKPGRPPIEDEVDVTWLDKAITAFERKLKAIFGKEI